MSSWICPSLRAAVLAVVSVPLLVGCAAMLRDSPRRSERSSSVVDFLYPGQTEPVVTPGVPVLRLPLRVGVAFVPSAASRGVLPSGGISEQQKSVLLGRVANEFKGRQFIQSIEVIPSTYLRPGGGFGNLDQLRGLLSVDIVVLVSFDQVQFTQENKLSLAYWTVVGAYLFKGNRNDTHTLLEAVVYDIPSRRLLFRAPGVSEVRDTSTMVEVRERLRAASLSGFGLATDDLIRNLTSELTAFQEKVKNAAADSPVARIERRPGYSGGGAAGSWFAGGVLALLGLALFWQRRAA